MSNDARKLLGGAWMSEPRCSIRLHRFNVDQSTPSDPAISSLEYVEIQESRRWGSEQALCTRSNPRNASTELVDGRNGVSILGVKLEAMRIPRFARKKGMNLLPRWTDRLRAIALVVLLGFHRKGA